MTLDELLGWVALALVGFVLVVISVPSSRPPVKVAIRWLWVPRRIVAVGLLLLAVTALYPPWYARVPAGIRFPCKSGPLWSGPASCEPPSLSKGAQVDVGRLGVEWVVLAGITGGLALLAATKKA